MALDKVKYLKRVIIVAWVTLIVCFLIKIFGGNFFVIVCENERFIKVCEFADNNPWVRCIIGFLHSFVSLYCFILAICGRTKLEHKELIILALSLLFITPIKVLFPNIGAILDIWTAIILPLWFNWRNKRRWVFIPVANILIIVFQLISMFVKDLTLSIIVNNGILISLMFSIDVNIMLVLYCAYSALLNKQRKES